MSTQHIKRPPDAVRSTNGFEEAKKAENFINSCIDIRDRIRRDGPWPTINRVLGGRVERYEGASEKVCKVCHRIKAIAEFKISKVHNGRISRSNTCKECNRIARRMGKRV